MWTGHCGQFGMKLCGGPLPLGGTGGRYGPGGRGLGGPIPAGGDPNGGRAGASGAAGGGSC
eukprot:4862297-Heterocapsa_arctica.AAC.1